MIKFWKGILYLIIILLLLEILKKLLSKTGIEVSYFITLVIGCIQFFLLIGFFLLVITDRITPKKISARKRWIIALVVMLMFFSGAEWLATFWSNHPKLIPKPFVWSYTYYYDYFDSRLLQYEKNHTVYDPGLFYRLNPNSNSIFTNREFSNQISVNSKGLRDDELSLKNPSIICLGDSYTMGWGVENKESYPQQLEAISGLRVLNAGIPSYGTARELELLKQLDTSAAKYIVIQYCSNDDGENEASKENRYQLQISSQNSFDSLLKGYNWGRVYFPGKHFLSIGPLFVKHELNKLRPLFRLPFEREMPLGDTGERAHAFLDVLSNSKVNFGNAKIIVTVLDSYDRSKNDILTKLEELSKQEPYKSRFADRLLIVRLNDVLDRTDFFEVDVHVRASGYKKIADKLWGLLQKN